MPTLNWIGKEAVANYHKRVPFHLLRCDESLSVGDAGSGNLLIEGDNLVALKALLPYYGGQVKCIYIDPPYNTGNEKWAYNDAVNSPEMRDWLGKAVGGEADDLSRHDKWLCMMYPRLELLRQFLRDDGVIFVSIDDTELPRLRVLMDDLFLPRNLVACLVWQTEGNFDNQAKIKICHEYVLVYAKDARRFPAPPVIDPGIDKNSKLFRDTIRNTIVKNGPKNPVSDIVLPAGFPADFESGVIPHRNNAWPHYGDDVVIENSALSCSAIASSGWSSKAICEEFIAGGCQPVADSKGQKTRFVITRTGAIECIKERREDQSHVVSVVRGVGTVQQMGAMFAQMGIEFDYPKPLGLIQYLISMVAGKDFVVMDSFAGSATTGHAVLAANKADGGSRRFVLIEMDKSICQGVAAKRLTYAVNGYSFRKTNEVQEVAGLGGGFRHCVLGPTLFDEAGRIRAEVTFADLAAHVYFAETGEPIRKRTGAPSTLLGVHSGTAVYLLYNGVLGDKTANGGNVVTRANLQKLPPHDGPRVVYGTGCRIGADRLKDQGITFRQIPYELRVD